MIILKYVFSRSYYLDNSVNILYLYFITDCKLLFSRFDNSLERTIEERLNLELFLTIPAVSVRTLQGGGDLQWVGTETELESARCKAQIPTKDGAYTTTGMCS